VPRLFPPLWAANRRLGGGQRPQRAGGTSNRLRRRRATEAGPGKPQRLPASRCCRWRRQSHAMPSGWPGCATTAGWGTSSSAAGLLRRTRSHRPLLGRNQLPENAFGIPARTLQITPDGNLASPMSLPFDDLAGTLGREHTRPRGGRRQVAQQARAGPCRGSMRPSWPAGRWSDGQTARADSASGTTAPPANNARLSILGPAGDARPPERS